MTTADYLTQRMLNAYATILASGTTKEKRQSRKRLVEIAQRCRNEKLAARAHQMVAQVDDMAGANNKAVE